ncbi:hybrid sensor histidine kinase/response regulator [Nonlabens arenilitoris]|uniref:histidine kinase n=1 Tax=Nonlabens arenilitoris TaxID=1217969 RepID=A0A2S7UA01_9FLAO|nr:hybrid sensor histidine kinase/response regulator [Nonlabens arenilitoris]PQJ31758.1 hybrid sensor histidine kinase/response regulator [Nonlabens arenilitoris]
MAMHALQRDYSTKDLQFISINKQGTILTTDQQLFEVNKDSSIKDFHPFFESIDVYFLEQSNHIKLECVHLNDRIFDIDFIKNDDDTAVIIFREGTKFYNRVQLIAQKRNESIIFQETLELKNQILKEQEEFKNRFIGNFSHELRNPLTLVSSFSSMLLKTELNLDQEMLVEAIKDQSDKLRDILNDIIDLSILKNSSLSLDSNPFSLRKLLKNVHLNYSTTSNTKDLTINLKVDENVPKTIIGDKRRFEQIITNFLDNALRHNKGDSIEINIKENQRRANKVSLRIEVINNNGIIPDILNDQDIETYTNLDNGDIEKTTGLSFSIARELAQLMDGEILIKPLESGGTQQVANLKLVFPIHDKEIVEETEETAENSKINLTEKVRTIIAEDNSVTQMTALKILVGTGNFDTRVFTDPKNLLEAVDKDDYDLILMSSSISQVDALELISLIKEFANDHNKKIPMIAVSTKTSASDLVEYRKAGFKDVVKKPYTDDELLNTIYKRLNLKKFK